MIQVRHLEDLSLFLHPNLYSSIEFSTTDLNIEQKSTQMRFRALSFIIWAVCLLATSCGKIGKDEPVPVKDGFAVGDRSFDFLSDAIREALQSSDNTILLEKDVQDDAVLNIGADEAGEITLDLGTHNYTALATKGLDFGGLDVELLSGGGSLICEKGAISSASSIYVAPDFKGRIDAAIKLDNAWMQVESADVAMNIPELTANGEGRFELGVKPANGAAIVIDKLTSDGKYPVVTSYADGIVINNGGKVHVHAFKSVDVSPACYTVHEFYDVCEECGYAEPVEIREVEAGPCNPDSLVHHPSSEPTDTEFGNIEYWECPYCGAVYLDAQGKIPAEEGISLLPGEFVAGAEFLRDYESAFEPNSVNGWDAVTAIATILMLPLELSGQLAQIATLGQISENLLGISNQLGKIQQLLDQLLGLIKEMEYKNILGTRIRTCMEFSTKVDHYYDQHIEYLKEKAGEDAIKANLSNWWNNGGREVTNQVHFLLKEYCNCPFQGSIPRVQEKLTLHSFAYEHLGYDFRNKLTMSEFARISRPYFLAVTYMKNVSTDPAEKNHADSLFNDLKRCLDVCRQDSTRMAQRNDKYRIYCTGGGQTAVYTISNTAEDSRFLKWFENKSNLDKYYFPYDNKDHIAETSCDQLLKDIGFEDQQGRCKLLERQHVENTITFFRKKDGTSYNSMYIQDFLEKIVGFKNLAEGSDNLPLPVYLFGNSFDPNYNKFIHQKEWVLPPFLYMSRLYYKHVHYFVNSKVCKNNDHFRLENCAFRPHREVHLFMAHKEFMSYGFRDHMNIKSSTGKITNIGEHPDDSRKKGYYIERLYDVD